MIQGFAVHADGTVDEALLERLRARTELFCADAASTEQLAGQLLRTTGILPNLRFITRDRAHACQRLLSRPWAADLAVKEILDVFCMSSTSLVGRIQFSPHLQQVFQNFCEASQHNAVTGSRIKHLSWAKHRFSSISKPLGRAILHLDALLTTAVWLVVHCKDPNAVTFLETIGERELLLAAMMADAADEAVRLLRFFGEEGYELAEVAFQIRLFMSRVHVLFNEEKVYELGGYTKHCLQLLSSSRGFMLGGEARTLGGPGKAGLRQTPCMFKCSNFERFEYPQSRNALGGCSEEGLVHAAPSPVGLHAGVRAACRIPSLRDPGSICGL